MTLDKKEIEKIKKEVLEEEYERKFTKSKQDKIAHSEIIELTIRKTAQEIFRDLENIADYGYDFEEKRHTIVVIDIDDFKELKKKWGVEE